MKAIPASFFAVTALSVVTLLTTTTAHADTSFIGREGTGRPTNTVVGALFGAATGAAVGQATGGKDGWWIGTLVGTAVGGAIGNAVPTSPSAHRVGYSDSYYSHPRSGYYRPAAYRHPQVREYCPPVRTVVQEVVVERPIHIAPAPVVSVPYGFLQNDGTVKSPWSDFSLSLGGLSRGQTVYDPHTGQPFLVP